MKTIDLIDKYFDQMRVKEKEEAVVVPDPPTMSMINNYLRYINEQGEDPLAGGEEAPIDATDVTEQPPEEPAPLTVEGERYLIRLLVKAFLHVPDETEGKIVKELQSTMLDNNPKDVAESIESMVEISQGDMKSVLRSTTSID